MKRKTNRSFLILLCMLVLLSLVPAAVLADGAEAAANADASRLITAKEAQEIALKDAGLDEVAQKIVFTEIELILNQGRPCYVLDFYTGESRYYYQIDAKSGEIIFRNKYILPAEARRIAVEDAGCTDRVLFTEETLVDGGIKSPYYRLVFADTKTQWTYRIDAVLGNIMGKEKENIGTGIFIPLRQAQEIALKDAGLDEVAQKIVFTKIELSRNQGRPCYVLDFYTGESRYYYQIDAKTCEIIFRNKYILPAEARRIAVEDVGCTERVLFTEETLVDGGIKSPYYRLVFADMNTQWTYRIDAVLGIIMGKEKENIGTGIFIPLRQAQEIALKDAGLDEVAQKIVFTEIELILNQGRPCYVLDFYTGESRYYYQIDAKSGEIIFRNKYILPAEARRIAVEDAGCTDRVLFTEETLVDGGIKSPYYRLVFADTKTQWTYRIDAVLGNIMGKEKENIGTGIFIPLRQAQEIALKDAGLDEVAQKIVFTKIELSRNQGRPCYVLDFYTGESRYYYQIDAKTCEIIFRNKYILPAEARRIAVEDVGCTERVLFTEETLVDGGIKSPYYRLVFADMNTQWTYRIDAVLGIIMGKEKENIGTGIFIPLRQAQEIALKDAGLDEVAQKIVFTEIELILNQGRPCYVLDFYTGESRYYYQIDAKTCEIIFRNKYILPAEARRIAVEDAGCTDRVLFIVETLVDGGIKSPYYLLVFADAKTQWTYRIDAVLGNIMGKEKENIGEAIFIPLRQAQEIALKDAGLDEVAQKIVFTKIELSRNQGRPCYVLDFYTGENRYFYRVDAKTGEIIFRSKYILLAEARRIAVEDAGCTDRVLFTEETLVDGGIKSPYYRLVFADMNTQWTYRIDAVLGTIMGKEKEDIGTTGQAWKNPFGDVRESDWFYRSVKFAYAGGLMRGVSDTEFSPDTDVTRAMFVMILYRIEKEPQAGSTAFADVEIGDYYEKAVAWANANGIVSGVSEKRFAPNEPITREQMATIIYRYAAFKGYDIRTSGKIAYTDSSDISDYAKDAVSWAAEEALMAGHADGRFLPRENATRAQTAAVFMRMLGDSK